MGNTFLLTFSCVLFVLNAGTHQADSRSYTMDILGFSFNDIFGGLLVAYAGK